MAVLADTHPTLLDLQSRMDPNGNIASIVEMLNQTNEVLEDMVWLEANNGTTHKTTIRTGLPTPTWRKLYQGVIPNKSRTAQVTETTGNMEQYAEVDKDLVDLSKDPAAFRLSEDRPHIEGMNQEFVSTLFYGNDLVDDAEFTGIAPRFNSLSAENADNIVRPAAGVDGNDNSSIYLVVWGPNTVHGIYPAGMEGGLQQKDLGEVTLESAPGGPAGGRMQAYRTHYKWACGVSVRDWRYVVRIQFNQEDLVGNAATGPDLIDLMIEATERIPTLGMGRPAFYMNRRVRTFLRKQIRAGVSNTITYDTIAGKRVLAFDGIPVRRVDQLLATEAAIA